jgi:hypothetical protein
VVVSDVGVVEDVYAAFAAADIQRIMELDTAGMLAALGSPAA